MKPHQAVQPGRHGRDDVRSTFERAPVAAVRRFESEVVGSERTDPVRRHRLPCRPHRDVEGFAAGPGAPSRERPVDDLTVQLGNKRAIAMRKELNRVAPDTLDGNGRSPHESREVDVYCVAHMREARRSTRSGLVSDTGIPSASQLDDF